MKNLKVILVVVNLIIFNISCSSDDDSSNDFSEANLIGTWKMIETTSHDESVRTENGISETYLTDNNSSNITTERVYESDYTYQQTGGQTLNYLYTNPDGSTEEQTLTVTTIGNGTWLLNDNNLTLTVDGQQQGTIAEILTLNATTLKIKITIHTEYELGNANVVANFETLNTFERQ